MDGGRLEILVDTHDSHISSIRFMGDYLGLKDVQEIEQQLMGVRFKQDEVIKVLDSFDLSLYFGSITLDEILSVLFY